MGSSGLIFYNNNNESKRLYNLLNRKSLDAKNQSDNEGKVLNTQKKLVEPSKTVSNVGRANNSQQSQNGRPIVT